MPTPFTHLAYAQIFQQDNSLNDNQRMLLNEHWGDFLFGSIAPDSQHMANLRRHETHFFHYGAPPVSSPVKTLLDVHPALAAENIQDKSRLAFLAGYMGHLAVDEMWWNEFFYPNFSGESTGDWRKYLFYAHALLAIIDQRDYESLTPDLYETMQSSAPNLNLPFIKDDAVVAWRDLIAKQISPDGEPQTLEILGGRLPQGTDALIAFLEDTPRLERELWGLISREALAIVESQMQKHMATTIMNYLAAY